MLPVATICGLTAFLAVLLTLGDPGITSDEPIDVRVGRQYLDNADAVSRLYLGLLRGAPQRRDAERLFADNAQHPPLGRVLVGLAAFVGGPFENVLGGPDPFGVHAARLAPALAFGALVGLLVRFGSRRYGLMAGLVSGLALVLMPRAFAHGHFATLDTFLCLFWLLALFRAVEASESPRPVMMMAFAGLFWGLALLTKIHAWLLPPVILLWLLIRVPWRKAALAMSAWGATGVLTFLAGWPWLWFDSLSRLGGFLNTSVNRLPLRVEYFGQVYLDHDVPWHYPWLYFAATVPIGLHLCGAIGVRVAWQRRRSDPLPLVLTATILGWLLLFSTNAPVYDGERLFLVAFPVWAILVGLGFSDLWRAAGSRNSVRVLLAALLAAQGYGLVVMHPFGLSYYNGLVGGLPGAERLGLELTYWGDSVDATLLEHLAEDLQPGQIAALAPTLHHLQAPATTTQALFDLGATLRDEAAVGIADRVVVYRRSSYWSPEVRELVGRWPPREVRSRQGVWLSGIWEGPARE